MVKKLLQNTLYDNPQSLGLPWRGLETFKGGENRRKPAKCRKKEKIILQRNDDEAEVSLRQNGTFEM